MKKFLVFHTCILGILISALAFGPVWAVTEQRKVTVPDIEFGTGNATSAGGHVGARVNATHIPVVAGDNTLSVNDAVTAQVDVRAYGAVIDNTTDDSVAFLAAVASLDVNKGGKILVPGFMALGSNGWAGIEISNRKGVTIAGTGPGSSGIRILYDGSNVSPIVSPFGLAMPFIVDNCDNFTLKDLDIDGSAHLQVDIGIYRSNGVTVTGNRFHKIPNNSSQASCLQSSAVTNGTYSYNVFEDWLSGIGTGTGTPGWIDNQMMYIGNTFRRGMGNPIIGSMQNSAIIGNVFIGARVGETPAYSAKVKIAGGPYTGVTDDNAVSPANITVSGNAWRGSTGIHPMALYLQGNGYGNGPRNISITGNTFEYIEQGGVTIDEGDSVTVTGNTLKNCGSGISLGRSKNLNISGNIVKSDVSSAAGIGGTVDNTLTGLGNYLISNNMIDLTGSGSYGIFISSNGINSANHLMIHNNHISANGSGVYLYTGIDNLSIKNNYIWSDTTNPLVVKGTSAGPSFQVFGNALIPYGPDYDLSTNGFWYTQPVPGTAFTQKQAIGSAAPTLGVWKVGDFVTNTGGDNVIGWKCTVAGTDNAATWKSMSVTLEP